MDTISRLTLEDYISTRERQLIRRILSPKMDETQTALIRGQYEEVRLLKKQLETNFANPGGSQ